MDENTTQTEALGVQENVQKNRGISLKINIKTAIIVAVIIALGVFAYFYKGLFIAATVDGNPISRLSVISELEKASGKNLLDSLIVEKLIQNAAKANDIVISGDEVNAEIAKIEDQITAQGGTLESALSGQGMTAEDLNKQIALQLQMEALLADKISVTNEEVAQYISDYAISIPEGEEDATTAQIRDDLRNQKLNSEAGAYIANLRAQAKISYFVNY